MENKQQMSDFENLIKSSTSLPLLVFFYSPICGASRLLNSALQSALTQISQQLNFVKINSELYDDLANQYEVHSLPVLLIFKDGQLQGRIEDEHIENLLPTEKLTQQIKSLL